MVQTYLPTDHIKAFGVDRVSERWTEFYLAGCVYRIDTTKAESVYDALRAALLDGTVTMAGITEMVELLGAQRIR